MFREHEDVFVFDAEPICHGFWHPFLIVPDDVVLEVEAWADNKDIGYIELGQKAEVKVETFNFQKSY